ncbi:unnamed protein product [Closterium sp. NIES-54]
MRMASVHYSTASYLTHFIKGLTSNYNLLKRQSLAPSTKATLNEDSLTSYILQDEAMQEAEKPLELLAHVNYVAPVKQGGRPGQRGQSGGGGSSGWKPTKDADKNKGQDDKEASCSLVGVVEPTVSLAAEAGEDFQAMAAAVQANPAVNLLDSGCSHHLMGTKEVFVDLQPSGDVKYVHSFNGALQDVQGRDTVALQGEAGRQVLIPNVLYVPLPPPPPPSRESHGERVAVSAVAGGAVAAPDTWSNTNLLSAGQLKENGVKLQEDGDRVLLVSAAGDVLGRASYTGRVLCTDLRPCSTKSTTYTTEVVVLLAIVSVTKSTPDRLHARLAHVGMNAIRSSAKHEVATGLDLESASGANLPCVSCVGRKLARHTLPDQGSDADDVLAVMHVDLPVAKKSDALQEFVQWLAVTERQTKKLVLMLSSDWGGEFLGKQFTDFVNGKGIVHDLTCPYTPQQNGMAEHEMRSVVELVRMMLLHMGVQHHWWHLALRQAVWVRNCLEWSTLQPGTTPYQLLTRKKPDLSLARELLDIADNRVVTTSDVVFYENMSLEVWKSEHGPASGRTPTIPPTDTSTATLPLLAKVGEPAAEDVEDVPSPFPSPPLPPVPLPLWPTCQVNVRVKSMPPGEEQAEEVQPTVVKSAKGVGTRQQPTGEQAAAKPTKKQSATRQSTEDPTTEEKSAEKPAEVQQDDEGNEAGDDGGDAEESTDSDVVEVQRRPRQSGQIWRPPDFYVPATFPMSYDEVDDDLQYDHAEEDEDFPELDPDMHADPEHRWDISTMMVKEALASWKGKAMKAAMEEEIRSLVGIGTWELVEIPQGVNIMKNRWVLMTKYHIDDTVEREKARLVVKGFTQVYGADYDETYPPVSSYVFTVLDLNLMQLDMKNAFL